jgi:enoyl-CoA hydratase/carnithine racemase
MTRIAACRHPVVARILGLCVGGGLELALTADLRLAGESARFGIPVKRLGLVVAYSELEPLLQLVGPANALEILLEGRIFGAEDALRMGLINRVVPDAELDAELEATVARIAEGAPLVARWHKKFTRRLLQPVPLTAEELDESFHCFGTEDFRAGYKAFLAKTKPRFEGR